MGPEIQGGWFDRDGIGVAAEEECGKGAVFSGPDEEERVGGNNCAGKVLVALFF